MLGPRKKAKKPATKRTRLTAVASMMASSLTKIERCHAPRRVRSLIAGAVPAADKAVAGPPHRADEGGTAGIVAELLAQPADQHVDRAVVGLPVDAPGLVQDALAAEDPAPAPHQEPEEREFGRGQGERAPREGRGAGRPAHLQRAGADALFVHLGGAPAQHRLD